MPDPQSDAQSDAGKNIGMWSKGNCNRIVQHSFHRGHEPGLRLNRRVLRIVNMVHSMETLLGGAKMEDSVCTPLTIISKLSRLSTVRCTLRCFVGRIFVSTGSTC